MTGRAHKASAKSGAAHATRARAKRPLSAVAKGNRRPADAGRDAGKQGSGKRFGDKSLGARQDSTNRDGQQVDDMRAAVTHLKRERIIAAAADLFYADGFVSTTLDAVAERLHVTKPFIYAHFRSKSELLGVICAHGIRASLDALDRVLFTQASATDKLAALMRGFMAAVLDNQQHIGIYTREEKHLDAKDRKAIEDMRREFDAKLRALLDAGVAAGEFKIADTQMASLAIGGIASWAYVWFRRDGRLGVDEIAAQMATMVTAMCKTRPAQKAAARKR